MSIENSKHILISRTDNIGDVILAFPMARLLKQQYPKIKISFLVRDYAADVVRLCPFVDNTISWDQLIKVTADQAAQSLHNDGVDCVVHAYPKSAVARLMKRAKIKYRVGSLRRVHHWFNCNVRIPLSYSALDQYEPLVNMLLLKRFGLAGKQIAPEFFRTTYLQTSKVLPERLRQYFHPQKFNLIIHPYTNGHTNEWPVSHFNDLIKKLSTENVQIFITGTAKEAEKIQENICSVNPAVISLAGETSLEELSLLIAHGDGLIANGTGPLHLAGAIGTRALGLYPATRGSSPARWAALGPHAECLVADPYCDAPLCRAENDCLCMESITVDQVKSVVMRWVSDAASSFAHSESAFKQGVK